MKKLTNQSELNSPQEYDRIYDERVKKGPNWQDIRRWKKILKYYPLGGNLLDIGCLDSKICELIDGRYTGIDLANEAIGEMRKKYLGKDKVHEKTCLINQKCENKYCPCKLGKSCTGQKSVCNCKRLRFEIMDLYKIGYWDAQWDYVVMGEVLEHLERPLEAVKEAWRLLKVGGTLAISVPLEEEKEPGAVDRYRHIWSFDEEDIINMIPGKAEIKTKVLRSQYFPRYHYAWPSLILWAKKL